MTEQDDELQRLTLERLNKWMEYIDARIDEKIQTTFGRDSLSEAIKVGEIKREIEVMLRLKPYSL